MRPHAAQEVGANGQFVFIGHWHRGSYSPPGTCSPRSLISPGLRRAPGAASSPGTCACSSTSLSCHSWIRWHSMQQEPGRRVCGRGCPPVNLSERCLIRCTAAQASSSLMGTGSAWLSSRIASGRASCGCVSDLISCQPSLHRVPWGPESKPASQLNSLNPLQSQEQRPEGVNIGGGSSCAQRRAFVMTVRVCSGTRYPLGADTSPEPAGSTSALTTGAPGFRRSPQAAHSVTFRRAPWCLAHTSAVATSHRPSCRCPGHGRVWLGRRRGQADTFVLVRMLSGAI